MTTLNKFVCLIILISLGFSSQAEQKENHTQNKKHELKLKKGSFVPYAIDGAAQKKSLDIEEFCFDSYYYAVVQFNELPNFQNTQKLKALDVHLGNYIPENAYRAKISTGVSLEMLKEFDVRSIYYLKPAYKISSNLQDKLYTNKQAPAAFETQVIVHYNESLSADEVGAKINTLVNKAEFDKNKKQFLVKATGVEISKLSEIPFIDFIEEHETEVKLLGESATVQLRGRYFHNSTAGIEPKLETLVMLI